MQAGYIKRRLELHGITCCPVQFRGQMSGPSAEAVEFHLGKDDFGFGRSWVYVSLSDGRVACRKANEWDKLVEWIEGE